MAILYGATCIVGIIFMVAFLFIGIWLFKTALKSYEQLRYKNYILEKIYQKLSIISNSYYDEKQSNEDDIKDLLDLDKDEKISHINQRKRENH